MNYNAGTEGAQRVEAYMIFHSLMFFGATVLRNGRRYLVVISPLGVDVEYLPLGVDIEHPNMSLP